ncbi:hypothetical protein EFA69_16165 [Rufibacter immobilis]|uniref:Uncharacterized protein n=1 Tax=Rufibacter immobilis TaxID=1348778 RepID=A0A3M9MQ40_9BACT|nr:hypothetical protein [Rufibacter immobilis]RNI27652.1 hypothetical protein EFA69_16165 [Rufibacter immobilis]
MYAEILDEEVINEIENNARLAFTDRQIALIVGIPYPHFEYHAAIPESPVSTALTKGRLMAEAEVRESIFKLARSGSKDAQIMAIEYFQHLQIDNEQ